MNWYLLVDMSPVDCSFFSLSSIIRDENYLKDVAGFVAKKADLLFSKSAEQIPPFNDPHLQSNGESL